MGTCSSDPRTFPRGDEFIPERWTTRPELVRDATVYSPFSVGRFSCVGKQLGRWADNTITPPPPFPPTDCDCLSVTGRDVTIIILPMYL